MIKGLINLRCKTLSPLTLELLSLTSNNENKESLTPFFTHRLKGKGMENLVVVLDERLHKWHPQIADEVKIRVAEIIDYADQGTLDLSRSRRVEQEVMDLIDED